MSASIFTPGRADFGLSSRTEHSRYVYVVVDAVVGCGMRAFIAMLPVILPVVGWVHRVLPASGEPLARV